MWATVCEGMLNRIFRSLCLQPAFLQPPAPQTTPQNVAASLARLQKLAATPPVAQDANNDWNKFRLLNAKWAKATRRELRFLAEHTPSRREWPAHAGYHFALLVRQLFDEQPILRPQLQEASNCLKAADRAVVAEIQAAVHACASQDLASLHALAHRHAGLLNDIASHSADPGASAAAEALLDDLATHRYALEQPTNLDPVTRLLMGSLPAIDDSVMTIPGGVQAARKSQLGQLAPVEGTSKPMRLSCLDRPGHAPMFLTGSLYRGGYGKVRLAYVEGDALAIKEMRRRPAEARPRGAIPTYATLDLGVLKERRYIEMAHGTAMPVQHLLTDKSNWLTMPLMSGTLSDFTTHLYARSRSPMERLQFLFAAAKPLTAQLYDFHTRARSAVRDIKGQNILVHPNRGFRLMDFGLVAHVLPGTDVIAGDAFGTPGFAAPETYTPGAARLNADVWSLGVTLARLVLPLTPSPFDLKKFGAHYPASYADQANLAYYSAWHASQPRNGLGEIDIARLGPRSDMRTEYFVALRALHPRLCFDFLQSILHPDPKRRFQSDDFARWAEAGAALIEGSESTVQGLLQEFASASSRQRNLIAQLSSMAGGQ